MRHIAFTALAGIGLSFPGQLLAVECTVPGTTLTWATDQCLLETRQIDPGSKEVIACLSKKDTSRQPCEWNSLYKEKYCATLIATRQYWGDIKHCAIDPEIIGPTVREHVRSQKRET